jgi:hypothetical protein
MCLHLHHQERGDLLWHGHRGVWRHCGLLLRNCNYGRPHGQAVRLFDLLWAECGPVWEEPVVDCSLCEGVLKTRPGLADEGVCQQKGKGLCL